MNGEGDAETAPEPQGKRLTLLRARLILIGQPFYVLLMCWAALGSYMRGDRLHTIIFCFGAVSFALALPACWKRYRLVKAGAVVMIPPKDASTVVPSFVAVFVVSVWTLLVLIVAAGSVVGLFRSPVSPNVEAVVIGVNLFLWYVTGYLWYRVRVGWRKRPAVQPGYKPQEGVWPPAPRISENEDAQAHREMYTYQRLTNLVTRGRLTYRTNVRRSAQG